MAMSSRGTSSVWRSALPQEVDKHPQTSCDVGPQREALPKYRPCKGSLQKKPVKVGKWSKPRLTPPLQSLDSLTVTFFIVQLALIDHEMYFELNLYFPSQKWSETLHFSVCLYYKAKLHRNGNETSKCQNYLPKNKKNILCVYFVFQSILNIFLKTC